MRGVLVEQSRQLGVSRTARHFGLSRRTVYRWRRRAPDFRDRPCRPHRSPRRTADALEATILGLRLSEQWGPDRIGPYLGLPASTAYAVLRRHHLSRLAQIFPPERPVRGRYPDLAPGELIAIDIKSLGRLDRGGGRRAQQQRRHGTGVGWRHLHVAIDMASRLVFAQLRSGLGADDAIAFLRDAVAFFDSRRIRARRVLTDNGTAYKRRFDSACRELGLRHTKTKPHHPWTNGRVERFIRTIQRECLYGHGFFTSEEERALAVWLYLAYYNDERPHLALGGLSPRAWLSVRRCDLRP
jgi:transposase InsO family protein